jgi:putative membrane protein
VTHHALWHPLTPAEVDVGWTFDPWGLLAVIPPLLVYTKGAISIWSHAGLGHGLRIAEAVAYLAGASILAGALLSPLDALSEFRFAAHMSQHESLMLLAAPLIVLGRPLFVGLWALPSELRTRVRGIVGRPAWVVGWSFLTAPLFVLALHALVRWIWHVPALFEAAMLSEPLHAFQHASFFLSAALFWWAVLHGRYGRGSYGVGLLFVFATALHTSLLAALLTLAPSGFYPIYAVRGLDTPAQLLEDQQLGGLLMWVPSGMLFALIGLALFVAWLGDVERRAKRKALRAG